MIIVLLLRPNFYQAQVSVTWKTYSKQQGMLISPIMGISQDSTGVIWMAGPQGVQSYDGSRFRYHDLDSSTSNTIIRIDQISDHSLWLTTFPQGIYKYDYKKAKFTLTNTISSSRGTKLFSDLYLDRKGRFWKVNFDEDHLEEQGLYRINKDGESLKKYVFDQPITMKSRRLTNTKLNKIAEDEHGKLWISSFLGMIHFDPESEQFHIYTDPSDHDRVSTWVMYHEKQKCVILGTWGAGIKIYDIEKKQWSEYLTDPKSGRTGVKNIIYGMCHENDFQYWVASSEGLFLFDLKLRQYKKVLDARLLPIPSFQTAIQAVYKDRDGNVWVSSEQGLVMISRRSLNVNQKYFHHLDEKDGRKLYIHRVFNDEMNNTTLYLTYYSNAIIVESQSGKQYLMKPKDRNLNDVFYDEAIPWRNGLVLLKTNAGWMTPDYVQKTIKPWKPDMLNPFDRWLSHGTWYINNEKLIGYDRKWVYAINVNSWELDSMELEKELDQRNIIKIVQKSNKDIFIVHGEKPHLSVFRKTKNKYCEIRHWNDLILFGMVEHPNGNVYACSYTQLYQISADLYMMKIPIPKGVPADKMTKMQVLPNGEIWIQSNHALLSYHPIYQKWNYYSTNEGLDIFEPSISYHSKQNRVILGSDYRTVSLTLDHLPWHTKKNVPLRISKITVNDSIISSLQQLRELTYNQNYLTFEFSALDFDQDERTEYRYRLKGLEDHWTQAGIDHVAHYTSIPPGQYTLEIEAEDRRYGWKSQMLSVPLIIHPPFWQTWWFYTLIILCIAFAIQSYYAWKMRKIREEEALKLAFARRESELEMKSLRSQMNPHFIFNSLNAINGFIVKDDKRNAMGYLTKFSRLVRQILDHSRTGHITINEEVDSLELYLQLESLRFNQQFTYSIQCPNELKENGAKIPPMLIQPFVENAIWHGLMHAEHPGFVSITFIPKGHDLVVEIRDNGIGREASSKMKKSNHTSHGLNITMERLAHVHPDAGIIFTDLKENEKPAGTLVTVTLPGIL